MARRFPLISVSPSRRRTLAQVTFTSHGAVLRREVSRAILIGVGCKPVVVPLGEPTPSGMTVWAKEMAASVDLGGRRILGLFTGRKSRGTTLVRATAQTTEVSPRRLRRVSCARSVLLLPASGSSSMTPC